jgi:hypothetical protein
MMSEIGAYVLLFGTFSVLIGAGIVIAWFFWEDRKWRLRRDE